MQYFSSHSLELLAALAGFLNVFLAARANIWNFLFGIITVSLYLLIFYKVRLYADMSLQLIFLCLQFYGIYQWLYGGFRHSALVVHLSTTRVLMCSLLAVLMLFLAIAFLLTTYTDSNTVYLDAFATAVSLVAQWMMSKKLLENFLYWILVDLVSIVMYLNKSLYFTSGLYFIFLLICIFGYFNWKKQAYQKT